MPLPEYEAVARAPVESSARGEFATATRSSPGSGQSRTDPIALGQELERLRGVAAEAETRLAANVRRGAELEALCQARHTGLQILLAELHAAEQRAVEAERALSETAIPRAGRRRLTRAAAR
jgi:hypothetical protein